MNVWGALDGRLRRIERDRQRKDAYKHFMQYDGQRASPSCPPDYNIHIRGGWLSTAYGEQLPTPELTINFGLNPGGTWGASGWWGAPAFTNANYYQAAIVLRSNVWDSTANQLGTEGNVIWASSFTLSEFSTAECAEEHADYDLRWTLDSNYGYPVCIVILRNDGITDAMEPSIYGHVLPIDAVNRGRSYIWRDIRPMIYDPYRTTSVAIRPTAPTCT